MPVTRSEPFNHALTEGAREASLHPEDISLIVANVGSQPGVVFEHRADQAMQAASLGKLQIGLALQDYPDGANTDAVAVTEDLIVSGSGFLQFFGEDQYTADDLELALLRFSDNTAAAALIFNMLGGVEQVNGSLTPILGERRVTNLVDATGGFEHGQTTAREIAQVMRAVHSQHLRRSYNPKGIIEGYHEEASLRSIEEVLSGAQGHALQGNQDLIDLLYRRHISLTDQFPSGRLALKNGFYDDDEIGVSVNHQVAKGDGFVVASMIQTDFDTGLHPRAEDFHFRVGKALRIAEKQ